MVFAVGIGTYDLESFFYLCVYVYLYNSIDFSSYGFRQNKIREKEYINKNLSSVKKNI